MIDLEKRVASAVQHFWFTREQQTNKQVEEGRRDQGARGAVTGGAQLDGFINLVADLLTERGLPETAIIRKRNVVLPGYYRPTKEWDLLVVFEGQLIATIEFKSQIGPSFGNNYNNRTEEAIGSAVDLWAAYRDGAFKPSARPWLGYFMLFEEAPRSMNPVAVKEPHFKVFEEFLGASYAKRYEIFCEKLVRERLYDAACFLMPTQTDGIKGKYREPSRELGFNNFAVSLIAKAGAFAAMRAIRGSTS